MHLKSCQFFVKSYQDRHHEIFFPFGPEIQVWKQEEPWLCRRLAPHVDILDCAYILQEVVTSKGSEGMSSGETKMLIVRWHLLRSNHFSLSLHDFSRSQDDGPGIIIVRVLKWFLCWSLYFRLSLFGLFHFFLKGLGVCSVFGLKDAKCLFGDGRGRESVAISGNWIHINYRWAYLNIN